MMHQLAEIERKYGKVPYYLVLCTVPFIAFAFMLFFLICSKLWSKE